MATLYKPEARSAPSFLQSHQSFLFMLRHLLPLSFTIINAYASIGPVTNLSVLNAKISPDGFSRVGVLAEGLFPGPVIRGEKGDDFKINVIDKLNDKSMLRSTSIHWHGLNQHGTNWADGVAFISQCPISPGGSFEYLFHAKNQAGTFWYHSHISTQYCDGLRGPLVVYDPNDPHQKLYDVDDDTTIITLADWYKPAPQYGGKAEPDSTLINGLGRYVGGPPSPLAVVHVDFGKNYRFRLVSLSCDPNHVFSIDGHDLTVIEADGHNTEPVKVTSIQIFAGQRYSFILNAMNLLGGNFWIRALPSAGVNLSKADPFQNGTNLAILRYRGAPEVDPTTETHKVVIPLKETDLHPLATESPAAPGEPRVDGADVDMSFALGFDQIKKKFTVNGAAYVPPTVPVLLQILSGQKKPGELLPKDSIISIPANKTVQVSMPAGSAAGAGAPHPMHLHGHPFSVVRSAGSDSYNFVNPVRRDVVNTGDDAKDNVTIRFFSAAEGESGSGSAGVWILHCHIDRHMENGMAIVFAEDVSSVVTANPVPQQWKDLCPAYEAEFGERGEVVELTGGSGGGGGSLNSSSTGAGADDQAITSEGGARHRRCSMGSSFRRLCMRSF
ncbi:Cu-oxidase-domain-containing protein [Marasmius fiardii PR-910]|nr:Cu-oxidase-domain-containing protein [Marasmius fiardii PR-910]